MANRSTQYKYTVEMKYLNIKNKQYTTIKTECIKFIIIDHNYDENCMPIIYIDIKLDKKLLDDMILNCNENLIMLTINKFDNLTINKQEIECFRKTFTYFLPNDVNKNDPIDYNEVNEAEHNGNTFRDITLGLLCIDHINNNKRTFNFLYNNVNIGTVVNNIMNHFKNLVIQPIGNSDIIEQLMIPTQTSVNKSLKAINNVKVLYDTPYRYYQDFNFTYLLSSNGNAIKKSTDLYDSVIINIQDILSKSANEIGIIMNRDSETYEIPINYVNTEIFDNTIINKSQTNIIGVSSDGITKVDLNNKSSYLSNKDSIIRINNGNEGMLNNIKAERNNNNFFVYMQKVDLDTDVLSINKRITINHIDRYNLHNGNYLLYRKRECYIREDNTFTLNTMANFKEIYK